ncbi:SNF1-interacting protein [Gaertneriomyces sp. JEL0708]|nr:SNF1-interacting protein [Gaertneriomyces sp. JEL0708]
MYSLCPPSASADVAAMTPKQISTPEFIGPLDTPKAVLGFELAASDSPFFRARILQYEEKLEALAKALDAILRASRVYTTSLTRTIDAQVALSDKLSIRMGIHSDGRPILRLMSDALRTVSQIRSKMIDDISETMVEPLQLFLREDVRNFRNYLSHFEKVQEKYDVALARYISLSKTKDTTALREEAYVLYEFRKQYIRVSCEFAQRAMIFKRRASEVVYDGMRKAIALQSDFYETAASVFTGLKPSLEKCLLWTEANVLYKDGNARLESLRRQAEESAIMKAKPLASPGGGHLIDALTREASVIRFIPTPTTPTEKEGYLFVRMSPNKALTATTWARRYFVIRSGGVRYCTVSAKRRGQVLATPAINVLLCNIRIVKQEDRRFVFELSTVQRPAILLQAESEEDMHSWITTFEAAKVKAANQPVSTALVGPIPANDGVPSDDEDAGAYLRPVTLYDLVPQAKDNSPLDGDSPDVDDEGDDDEDEDADGDGEEEDANDDGGERDVVAGETAQGLATSSELGSPSSPVRDSQDLQCTVTYNDHTLARLNNRIHRLLKSLPKSEPLLLSASCAYQKDIVIHGRLFVLYNSLCFHSNILGFVNIIIRPLKEFTSIIRRRSPFFTSIIFNFMEGGKEMSYVFKMFLRDDGGVYEGCRLAWSNAKEEDAKRISPQQLYESIRNATRPVTDGLQSPSSPADGTADTATSAGSDTAPAALTDVSSKGLPAEYVPPPSLTLPTAEVPCGCLEAEHLDKREADVIINLPAKKVFETLFSDNSPWWSEKFHPKRGERDRRSTPWVTNADSSTTFEARLIMPLSNPMLKIKEAEVIFNFKLIKKVDFLCYVVESTSKTPDVPYGDAFSPVTRYCITWAGVGSCRVSMYVGLKWWKSVMVKGLIRGAAMKGLADTCADIISALQQEANEFNAKNGMHIVSPEGAGVASIPSTATAEAAASGASHAGHTRGKVDSGVLGTLRTMLSVQHALTALLVLSMLMNMLLLFRSVKRVPTSTHQSLLHAWDIRDLIPMSNPPSSITESFIATHFSNSSYLQLLPLHLRLRHYTAPQSALHASLSSMFTGLQSIREDVELLLDDVKDMERAILTGMWFGWIDRGLERCSRRVGDVEECGEVSRVLARLTQSR